MTAARDVFTPLLVAAFAAVLVNFASAGTTTTAATVTMKTMKKLLATVDPNLLADSVTRLIYCSSHHNKSLANAVSPHLADWDACAAKHPTDLDAHVACYLKSANNLPNFVALGQQVGNMVGCLISTNVTDVLCIKKVQKLEDCSTMCQEARSPLCNETVPISSAAVPATVRKDDCKLVSKAAGAPVSNNNMTVTLDLSMKVLQCVPLYFGDLYQHVVDHIKMINSCSQAHDENWFNWAKCLVDGHDRKLMSVYLVKARQAVACVVGGDLPAQTLCIRSVKTAEECKTCGGADSHPVEPTMSLGPTTACV